MRSPVGLALAAPWTERVQIGRFSGELINGQLLLTVTTTNPGVISGLAFGVFSLIDDDANVRVLGEARYYPRPEPTTIALGYGDLASVSGVVVFEPRAYNLRWLKRAESGGLWGIGVEAETQAAVTAPAYTPIGIAKGSTVLALQAVSTAAGNLAQVQWSE